ncbi:MAG: flavodoxin family protein [Faecalibacterium sp.]|nr:flavodoxin family protein [Ruminococcus flavefaciens]MCM1391691.1 flavodoxin family protein [Ruminococcus sp.]MCM1484643.1 flavodoxin family protein [Faecalibacterium sp.]
MKKIIISCGSKNGSSNYISKKIISKINNTELINLSDMFINYCDGCLTCDDTGICHFDDDMKNILEKIKVTTTLIFVTPARWNLLSGEFKVFMDRLNPFAVPEILANKNAAIFVVGQTATETSQSINCAIKSVEFFCNSANIEVIYTHGFGDCLNVNDTISKEQEIEESIKKFVTILERKSLM